MCSLTRMLSFADVKLDSSHRRNRKVIPNFRSRHFDDIRVSLVLTECHKKYLVKQDFGL